MNEEDTRDIEFIETKKKQRRCNEVGRHELTHLYSDHDLVM